VPIKSTVQHGRVIYCYNSFLLWYRLTFWFVNAVAKFVAHCAWPDKSPTQVISSFLYLVI
jgi:hypothetical protein